MTISHRKKALISFLIFIVIVTKDVLVSDFHVIPERSMLNRSISWFVILPISIMGVIFSIQVIKGFFFNRAGKKTSKINLNLILALPCLLYVLYYVVLGLIGAFYI